jgi:hypothetical protein
MILCTGMMACHSCMNRLFFEHRDLVLRGVFLTPAKLRDRKCEARFVRRAYLDKKAIGEDLHRYEESPPKCVGGFSKQDGGVLGILAIPEDAFALAHQNAAAHKIKFMTLRGEKHRIGAELVQITSFRQVAMPVAQDGGAKVY